MTDEDVFNSDNVVWDAVTNIDADTFLNTQDLLLSLVGENELASMYLTVIFGEISHLKIDEAKEREFESSLIEVLTSTEFESDKFVQGLFRLRVRVALCKLMVGIENKSILDEDGTNFSLSAVEGIIRLLDPLVKASFIDAAPVLGNIYKSIDREKAISLYQWAAEAGDEYAQYLLGNLYYEEYFDEQYDEYWDDEIDEPLEKAFHWYSLAANQGDSDAQRMLGEMYKDGLSVEDDLAEALNGSNLLQTREMYTLSCI